MPIEDLGAQLRRCELLIAAQTDALLALASEFALARQDAARLEEQIRQLRVRLGVLEHTPPANDVDSTPP